MIFFCTVMHTGSHTFKTLFEHDPSFKWMHTDNEGALELAAQANTLITTYRDPYRVAATWANRGFLAESRWIEQWTNYTKILDLNPIIFHCDGPPIQHGYTIGERQNTRKDRLGLHQALNEDNLVKYHQNVHKRYIELVTDILKPYKEVIFHELRKEKA